MVESGGQDPLILVHLIQVMDIFLIGTALLVFAVSLYACQSEQDK